MSGGIYSRIAMVSLEQPSADAFAAEQSEQQTMQMPHMQNIQQRERSGSTGRARNGETEEKA